MAPAAEKVIERLLAVLDPVDLMDRAAGTRRSHRGLGVPGIVLDEKDSHPLRRW
jgi:hypothetical protein